MAHLQGHLQATAMAIRMIVRSVSALRPAVVVAVASLGPLGVHMVAWLHHRQGPLLDSMGVPLQVNTEVPLQGHMVVRHRRVLLQVPLLVTDHHRVDHIISNLIKVVHHLGCRVDSLLLRADRHKECSISPCQETTTCLSNTLTVPVSERPC